MRDRTDWVRSITAWIFDLDNTLVECHRYYEETRKAVYEMLLRTGVPVTWSEFEQQLGVVRKPLFQSIGFGHESFAVSLRETFRILCEQNGVRPEPEKIQEAYNLGYSVLFAPYTLYPGAVRLLELLRRRGDRLALLTKGTVEAQQRKIRLHRLGPLLDHIEIAPLKSVNEVCTVLRAIDADPSETAVVGDSLFDDILSGRQAGCRTIWVNGNPIVHPELYGDEEPPVPDLSVKKVAELSRLIVPARRPIALAETTAAS